MCDVPTSGSYADLLEDANVDAIVIATPAAAHPGMVELAAAAGKSILCEKPLALEIAAAESAVAAANRAGVLLQIGFHRRFDADFRLAKARVERDELGVIYSYSGSMRDIEPPEPDPSWGDRQALLHDSACHDLDAARWLVGEIDEITTVGATLSSEAVRRAGQIDHAILALRFENGSVGVIDSSLASGYGFDCRCEIVGSKATIRIDNPYTSNVEWLTDRRTGFQRTRTFLDRFERTYPNELDAFVEAVRCGADPLVSGEDGLAAVVLTIAAERSFASGKTVRLSRRADGPVLRYAINSA